MIYKVSITYTYLATAERDVAVGVCVVMLADHVQLDVDRDEDTENMSHCVDARGAPPPAKRARHVVVLFPLLFINQCFVCYHFNWFCLLSLQLLQQKVPR